MHQRARADSHLSTLALIIMTMTSLPPGAHAGDLVQADCASETATVTADLPAPQGMNMNEPMPTPMAKEGTMNGDVMHWAARNRACMDRQLKLDERTIGSTPKP
jgi:hypothetical protein